MKTSKIYSEGCSGIRVDLTTYDRFAIAESVKTIERYRELHSTFGNGEEQRNELQRLEVPVKNIVFKWLTFFKKLVPNENASSNVFDEEETKKEMDE